MPKYTIADFLQTKSAVAHSLSPDGTLLAYLSNLPGTDQVYVVSTGGGPARQVTFFDESVSFAKFSPVSNDELIFGKDSKGNEKTQFYRLSLSTGAITPLTDRPDTVFCYGGWSRDGHYLAYASNQRNGTDFDIFVMDLETGEARSVFELGGYCGSLGFSPSARYLVVNRNQSNADNDLYLVDLQGHENPRHLTPHSGKATFGQACWLQNETRFFLRSNQDSDKVSLRLYDLAAGEMTEVLAPDWDVESLALNWDATALAVSVNVDGYDLVQFYSVSPAGKLKSVWGNDLPDGNLRGLIWSHDGAKLAFTRSSSVSSANPWIWDREINMSRQLAHMPMGVPSKVMVEPELIHYASFDGLKIPAFLYLPKRVTDEPMPAVVHIHGGPESQARPGFSSVIQYLVYRGIAVIEPNVRGSAGYGKAYMALDDREKRLDSVKDLEWLHRWIREDGRIDPDRVALMGGSYGGYMTLAGLAFQPDLWAAGVDIVGVANLETFLENTSSYRRALREAEYGYLATDRELLRELSPINRVDDMRAPLFIIHGANDPRVPLDEADQMHQSLVNRGIEVELLVYEDEGHGLSKLKNRLHAYPQVADFLHRILQLS